ncbi:uncharacterized protein [Lolium perenne]|uniref:uncharacterized protein n=1 Tax=Lolium perenne TaxID=4522 RepID=UPI0021F5A6B3|nr:uncharacterized protein LOC127345317 [Lolium perenne]
MAMYTPPASCSSAVLPAPPTLLSSAASPPRICFFFSCEMEAQDDYGKWRQIPAFGDWNHLWDDMPVAQYFDPAATFFFTAQAGEDDVDLFKVPHFAANPYTYKKCVVRVKKGEEKAKEGAAPVPGRRKKVSKKQQQQGKEQQRRKPKSAAAAAVDEDLYKISPNVICKVQKKKLLRNLLGGCLGLNCIA